MKIQINNLGPIFKFDFDLNKDLNVIFGPNNIGKSYAITTIYLIIKNFTNEEFRRVAYAIHFYIARGIEVKSKEKQFPTNFLEVNKASVDINNRLKENSEVEITNDIKKEFTSIINQLLISNLEKSFNNSFSSRL